MAFVYAEATESFCAVAQKQVFFRSYRKSIVCFHVPKGLQPPTERDCGGALFLLAPALNIGKFFFRETVMSKSAEYMNRLFAVALAANKLVESGKKDEANRYYIRVTRKRFNTLRRTLEALGEQKEQ